MGEAFEWLTISLKLSFLIENLPNKVSNFDPVFDVFILVDEVTRRDSRFAFVRFKQNEIQ